MQSCTRSHGESRARTRNKGEEEVRGRAVVSVPQVNKLISIASLPPSLDVEIEIQTYRYTCTPCEGLIIYIRSRTMYEVENGEPQQEHV